MTTVLDMTTLVPVLIAWFTADSPGAHRAPTLTGVLSPVAALAAYRALAVTVEAVMTGPRSLYQPL